MLRLQNLTTLVWFGRYLVYPNSQILKRITNTFLKKNLKNLLSEIYQKPFTEQNQVLQETILSWRGQLEQVDDIIVAGIKI